MSTTRLTIDTGDTSRQIPEAERKEPSFNKKSPVLQSKRLESFKKDLFVDTSKSSSKSSNKDASPLSFTLSPLSAHPYEEMICSPLRESIQILEGVKQRNQELLSKREEYAALLLASPRNEIELARSFMHILRLENKNNKSIQKMIEHATKMSEDVTQFLNDNRSKKMQKSPSSGKSISIPMMVHELRTPLFNTLGNLKLLQSNSNHGEYITDLEQAYRHLAHIADTLGQKEYHLAVIPKNFAVTDLINNVKAQTLQYDERVKIVFQVTCDTGLIVNGDFQKISQILINLISNAVKFSPKPGSVQVRINQSHHSDKDIHLSFEVEDRGPGISLEKQKELFQAYSTTQEKPIDTDKPSTGLGLYLSWQFVQAMDSQIQIRSELGKGSIFFFNLALNRAKLIDSPPPVLTKTIQLKKCVYVLAAEDDPVSLKLLNRYLTNAAKESFSLVTCVASGEKAIEKFTEAPLKKRQPYDVVILDMNMPQKTGWDTAKEIFAFAIQNKINPPEFLFITGDSQGVVSQKEEAEKDPKFATFATKVHVLTKPYDADILIGEINNLIEKLLP